jgi:UDP:flavonoid glycosyltransferase YjiC (YdhE family)
MSNTEDKETKDEKVMYHSFPSTFHKQRKLIELYCT